MKKITFLTLLLFFTFGAIFGQGNYQFPNNTFESWASTGSTTAIPTSWHSFSHNTGTWSSSANTDYSSRVAGHSGNYACKIMARRINLVITNINANGAMTTGQMVVNAANTSSDDNYIYSDIDNTDGHNAAYPFNGKPDSISIWAS